MGSVGFRWNISGAAALLQEAAHCMVGNPTLSTLWGARSYAEAAMASVTSKPLSTPSFS